MMSQDLEVKAKEFNPQASDLKVRLRIKSSDKCYSGWDRRLVVGQILGIGTGLSSQQFKHGVIRGDAGEGCQWRICGNRKIPLYCCLVAVQVLPKNFRFFLVG
jgi:hypothetical protein